MEFRAPPLLKSSIVRQKYFEDLSQKDSPATKTISSILSKLETQKIYHYKGIEDGKKEKEDYLLLDTTLEPTKKYHSHGHRMGPLWCTNLCCSPTTDKLHGKLNNALTQLSIIII